MSGPSAERSLQVDGTPLRYLEAGQGSPVVIVEKTGELALSAFASLLAQQFRVVVLELPTSADQEQAAVASRLNRAAAAIGLDHYVVIGSDDTAALALWQAVDAPERVDGLVLISPMVLLPGTAAEPALAGRLGEVKAPTLVLFGTNDPVVPPETGRLYVERLPECYYALSYDAGHDIAGDRPEALSEAVSDFVERRGTFIVERNSTALHP
jgi:pimeloyl-ACP methyl ester carboxylesterase